MEGLDVLDSAHSEEEISLSPTAHVAPKKTKGAESIVPCIKYKTKGSNFEVLRYENHIGKQWKGK